MKQFFIAILYLYAFCLNGSENDLYRTKEDLLKLITALLSGQQAGTIRNNGSFIAVAEQNSSSPTLWLLKRFSVEIRKNNTQILVFSINRQIKCTEPVSIFDINEPVTGYFDNQPYNPIAITLQDMFTIINNSLKTYPDYFEPYCRIIFRCNGRIESNPSSSKSNSNNEDSAISFFQSDDN